MIRLDKGISVHRGVDPHGELKFILVNQFLREWIIAIKELATVGEFKRTEILNILRRQFNSQRAFYAIIRSSLIRKGSHNRVKQMDEFYGIRPKAKDGYLNSNFELKDSTFENYLHMLKGYFMLLETLEKEFNIFVGIDIFIDSLEVPKTPTEVKL